MWAHILLAATCAAAAPPNFLFFITDDQDLSLGSLDVMPSVRKLAASGASATQAYVASPICCPSRSSLFSGKYPHRLDDATEGWCGNFTGERENTFTVALAASGFAVGQFGKWYNEEASFAPPYVPQWKTGSSAAAKASSFAVQLSECKFYNMTFNVNGQLVRRGDAPSDHLTPVVGNMTAEWLGNVTVTGLPWLAYVAFHAPHLPATPPTWYANASLPGSGAPRTPNYNVGWEDKHFQVNNGVDKPMSAALQAGADALWASRLRSLMAVDDAVRDILAVVEAAGQMDNTYVIFTSDHSYHLGQYGLWSEKSQPYTSDSQVPLFIRGPGIAPGTVIDQLVSNLDLAPTMLELAGRPDQWPDGSGRRDGRSLVPLLLAQGQGGVDSGRSVAAAVPWRDRLLIEFVGWTTAYEWLAPCQWGLTDAPCDANPPAGLINAASNCYSALRVVNSTANFLYGEWRPQNSSLAASSTNYTEAYDLLVDPWQMSNAMVSGGLPNATLQALHDELWALATCAGASCP